MDAIRDLELSTFATTQEATNLLEWLKSHDLETSDFVRKLKKWFRNFETHDDKKLALRLLLNFNYYSETLYLDRVVDILTNLSEMIAREGLKPEELIYVVDDDYLDSSVFLPYFASKTNGIYLASSQVHSLSKLADIDIAGRAIAILNDTQGSGNQFQTRIWPWLEARQDDWLSLYIVSIELGSDAHRSLLSLSPKVRLVPTQPTQYSLGEMIRQNYITVAEKERITKFGLIAHPAMPLGYSNSGLLVGYFYQCPYNTLAMFWGTGDSSQGRKWTNLFDYRPKRRLPNRTHVTQSLAPTDKGKRPTTTNVSKPDLKALIQSSDWTVGAVNFDEDLHFSSFYLRSSCASFMPAEQKPFGYSTVIAVYRDFNETYYIPQEECRAVAERLLARVLQDPDWLQSILDDIGSRARDLSKVFDLAPKDDVFDLVTVEKLLSLYKEHNRAHMRLYEIARIPEALDRGFGTFTQHLRSKLQSFMGEDAQNQRTLNAYFNVLTFPERTSLLYQEIQEFKDIVREVRTSPQAGGPLTGSSKRAVLRLKPELRAKLARHRDKWFYWGYHGYGSRAIPDAEAYLRRITSELSGVMLEPMVDYEEVVEKAESQRVRLASRLGMPDDVQLLFRLHSRIGLAKLLRRFYQLRNFYFLDRLLMSVATRIGESEAVVRSLLPSELERVLEGRMRVAQDHRQRVDHCVYMIHNDREWVFSDQATCLLVDVLLKQHQADAQLVAGPTLHGQSASAGIVRGQCRIIIRKDDADIVGFRRGDILVSESTDPDLREWIQESGGVITEAGGATCHAAIVCRELGKPAVVGVSGAIQRLHNGDWVVLDADAGTVTIQEKISRNFTVDGMLAFEHADSEIGPKAHSLACLVRAHLRVPSFFCVPLSKFAHRLGATTPDSDGQLLREVTLELQAALEQLPGEMFVLRSSMPFEDSGSGSQAGVWPSQLGVLRQDVVRGVFRYIEQLSRFEPTPEHGSVIVQEMILGDASGVCFTKDPRKPASSLMLLELVPGGNDALTDGRVTPVQFLISRDTLNSELTAHGSHWSTYVTEDQLRSIARICLDIEAIFGQVQDIEWTIQQGVVYVLQSRPNTSNHSLGIAQPAVRRDATGQERSLIGVIYRAYRVPPNLQRHLLRVAAVGKLICDNWAGPSLNATRIVAALLLHDIGNIVKADYDRFPELFPEEMKNLGYWKAIQNWMRSRFGGSDLDASVGVASELGVSESVVRLIQEKQFLNNIDTAAKSDFDVKIAAYADQRVGPHGVLTLEERLAEARRRYRGVAYASVNRGDFNSLMSAAFEIERQIDQYSNLALSKIDDEAISYTVDALKDFDISLARVC